jgi:hypothetical protein
MKLTQKERYIALAASFTSILSLLTYTIIHIFVYRLSTYSVYNIIEKNNLNIDKILNTIIFIGFLVLLYSAIKKYYNNYKRQIKNRFIDKFIILFFIYFVTLSNPFMANYIFRPFILNCAIFWYFSNFIGVITIIIFVFDILTE